MFRPDPSISQMRNVLRAAARFYLRPVRRALEATLDHAVRRTWGVRLGTQPVLGHEIVLRSPRIGDAEQWREVRTRERERIRALVGNVAAQLGAAARRGPVGQRPSAGPTRGPGRARAPARRRNRRAGRRPVQPRVDRLAHPHRRDGHLDGLAVGAQGSVRRGGGDDRRLRDHRPGSAPADRADRQGQHRPRLRGPGSSACSSRARCADTSMSAAPGATTSSGLSPPTSSRQAASPRRCCGQRWNRGPRGSCRPTCDPDLTGRAPAARGHVFRRAGD